MKRRHFTTRALREQFLCRAPWAAFGGMSAVKQAAIADAYDDAVHRPYDEAVSTSYRALKDGIVRQFCAAEQAGVRFEPWLQAGEPYRGGHKEMLRDLRRRGHLYIFRGGELPPDHPLAASSPLGIGDVRLTYNELFRGVHDVFGHAIGGFGFDAEGEEQAWRCHSIMFPGGALPALATEIRGQAAWFFHGRHVRREDQTVPAESDVDFVPFSVRPFAEQKAAILPSWCWLP